MRISKLIKKAKLNQGLTTDQQLVEIMNISHGLPYAWRKGAIPKIEHAHRLAELAGLDPAQVIADVLVQGTKAPEVKTTLERIKRTLAAAAAVIPALLVSVQYCILCKIAGDNSRSQIKPI